VKPIAREMIFYYYAKNVIAPSADQEGNYRFIFDRFKALLTGKASMSEYDREVNALWGAKACAFCGAPRERDIHLVPQCAGMADTFGVQNLVPSCLACAESKGERDFIAWWETEHGDLDSLPRFPVGLYLKIAYAIRESTARLREPCHDLLEVMPKDVQLGTLVPFGAAR
jgi:hypothetical protein